MPPYLNQEWEVVSGTPHAINNHTCDLARDDIVRDAIIDLPPIVVVIPVGQEPKEIMVDAIQVRAMLPRIVQTAWCDLGELAAAGPPRRDEGIHIGDESLAVALGSVMTLKRSPIVVQALLIAVPLVGFYREGVVRVRRALVVPVNLGVININSLHVICNESEDLLARHT